MVFAALYGFLTGGYPPLVGQIYFDRIESSTDIELQAAALVPHITFRRGLVHSSNDCAESHSRGYTQSAEWQVLGCPGLHGRVDVRKRGLVT